jgi:hypothetical protein
MDSEDDLPLAQSSPNGKLTNGHSHEGGDVQMSDGDDMPLVRASCCSILLYKD